MPQVYVVGFLFDETRQAVALIRKTKPEWQRGKLNGVGGKVEDGETPLQAMRREFWEETGVDVPEAEWEPLGTLQSVNSVVHMFRAVGNPYAVQTTTDEVVGVYHWQFLDYTEAVPNLRWSLPFCAEPTRRLVKVQF